MIDFRFLVTFDNEWDCFVAEIWHENIMLAEVTEHGAVHLYNEVEMSAIFKSSQFSEAIDYAKKKAKG